MEKLFIKRCIDLARQGSGNVNPNPMVGSVLVHNDKIIGEGYHQRYGSSHAEVNCLASVKDEDRSKINDSRLYVSLEPCCFHGNTPACTDLVIKNKIPKVTVSALDFTPEVSGNGVKILENQGIDVTSHQDHTLAKSIVRFRNTFVSKKRPYTILKFAVSQDGFIGKTTEQVWLTNGISKRLVHKWRSEISAIIVGTNTAIIDNPKLNNRLYFGRSPLRLVIDKKHKIPASHALKDDSQPTWIFSETIPETHNLTQTSFKQIDFQNTLKDINTALFEAKKSILLVEGGATLLQSYIDSGLWDEARIFYTPKTLGSGIKAPNISGKIIQKMNLGSDQLVIMQPNINQ